jgi:peptidoglycan/LPS O-acetylase OafA/YrhL
LARIYPVHLATLALMIVIWLVATRLGISFEALAFDPAALPQHVLLVQAWGTTPTDQWNFPSWSISAEWFAYLCFPAVAAAVLVFQRRTMLAVIVAAVAFSLLFAGAAAMGVLFTDMTSHIGAIRIIPSFLMGAAVYQLGSRFSLPRLWNWALLAVALIWIAVSTSAKASDLLIWPALVLLIFALGETAKHANRGLLGSPPLVYLGEASFALYMIHLPVDILYFHGLDKIAPTAEAAAPWLVWLGVFPMCVVAAIFVHEAVEKPARHWLRGHDPFARKSLPEPHDEPVI